WKPSIPQVFADLFPNEELAARSVPLPQLGEGARGVGPVHALAIACIHRVAHHQHDHRLIWMYDIHLLAGALEPGEADEFLELAHRKRIATVCMQAVSLAREKFATRLPAGLIEGLQDLSSANRDEPSAAYAGRQLRQIDGLLLDLAALKGWRLRLRFLREHV